MTSHDPNIPVAWKVKRSSKDSQWLYRSVKPNWAIEAIPLYAAPPPAPVTEACPNIAEMGEHACRNRHQCWEPCGELGHSAEHARVAPPPAPDERDANSYKFLYEELLMAVAQKWPNETRHQTALRYILEREAGGNQPVGQASKVPK